MSETADVHQYALRVARWLGAPDPEDVAQEAVITWLAHRGEVQTWRPWISRVVKNRSIDEHRRRKALGLQPLRATWPDNNEDTNLPPMLVQPSPSGAAMYRFAMADVFAAMSDKERRIFELRFRDGCSSAEVAAELSLTQGNVDVIVSRTRRRLRDAFPELFS